MGLSENYGILKKKRVYRRLFIFEKELSICRSSHPEVFLEKGFLKICSKLTGEHPYRSAISIKLQSNFIEITLRHGCSPVNLLYIFRTPFLKNTSGRLLLNMFNLSFNPSNNFKKMRL